MNGIGDKFDDFMKEQGLYDEAKELATKKLLTFQFEQDKELTNGTKSGKHKKSPQRGMGDTRVELVTLSVSY